MDKNGRFSDTEGADADQRFKIVREQHIAERRQEIEKRIAGRQAAGSGPRNYSPLILDKRLFELSQGTAYDPSDPVTITLQRERPELLRVALAMAQGDRRPFLEAATDPSLFEDLERVFNSGRVRLEKAYKKSRQKPTINRRELYTTMEGEEKKLTHTCQTIKPKDGKEKTRVSYVNKNQARTWKPRGRRDWRNCKACAHERAKREVLKIAEEFKVVDKIKREAAVRLAGVLKIDLDKALESIEERGIFGLYYTPEPITREEYKQIQSSITTRRTRERDKWLEAVAKTPEGKRRPLPPHDLIYAGYVVQGGVILTANRPSFKRRNKPALELEPLPTDPAELYDLVLSWIKDAPETDGQFIIGDTSFGGKFKGTRGAPEDDEIADRHEPGPKKLRITVDAPRPKIDKILGIGKRNEGGYATVALSPVEFIERLEELGIDFQIDGGRQALEEFVTGCVYTKPKGLGKNIDATCHKRKRRPAGRDSAEQIPLNSIVFGGAM